jgi:hypothetical protein
MSEFDPSEWPRFIELPGFTRAWTSLGLSDSDLTTLQTAILDGPNRHPVVPVRAGSARSGSLGRAKDAARAAPTGLVTPAF